MAFPAWLWRWNSATALVPLALAVAVKLPAWSLAARRGEVAMPRGPVVAVAWVEPPVKVAPAPPLPAEAPAAEAEPSVNVTVAPATGLPEALRTRDA